MALLGSSIASEVGLKLLLCPLGSNIVVRTACCSVGIVFPVYNTFKAVEKKDQHEQQKWLIYWAAYGSFSLAEIFADKIISCCVAYSSSLMTRFPLYYHVKFAFLVWLQLPYTNGARQLYMRHIRPFLKKHEARLDQVVGVAYSEMGNLVSSHQAEIEFVKSMVMKILASAHQTMRGIFPTNEQPQWNNATRGRGRRLRDPVLDDEGRDDGHDDDEGGADGHDDDDDWQNVTEDQVPRRP